MIISSKESGNKTEAKTTRNFGSIRGHEGKVPPWDKVYFMVKPTGSSRNESKERIKTPKGKRVKLIPGIKEKGREYCVPDRIREINNAQGLAFLIAWVNYLP